MKYRQLFALGIQNTLVYRWNFLLRSFFGLVPTAGAIYVWNALYHARGGESVAGYSYAQMVTYLVSMLVAESLATPVEDEWEIAADIREGRLSAFLLRPIDYPTYRLILFPSARLVYTAVTIWPIVLLVAIMWQDLVLPTGGLGMWCVAAVSLIMAGLIQFFISFALATLAFWFLEISTLVFIFFSFEYFLSGRLFPLDIMSPAFREISALLPFQYEMYFPVAILLGRLEGAPLVQGLCIQTAWVIVGWLTTRLMWSRGLSRYQAVGG